MNPLATLSESHWYVLTLFLVIEKSLEEIWWRRRKERTRVGSKGVTSCGKGQKCRIQREEGGRRADSRKGKMLEKRWKAKGKGLERNEARPRGARLCDIKLPARGIRNGSPKRDAPPLIEPPPSTCREHMCWWQHSDWKPDGLFSLLPWHKHPLSSFSFVHHPPEPPPPHARAVPISGHLFLLRHLKHNPLSQSAFR